MRVPVTVPGDHGTKETARFALLAQFKVASGVMHGALKSITLKTQRTSEVKHMFSAIVFLPLAILGSKVMWPIKCYRNKSRSKTVCNESFH